MLENWPHLGDIKPGAAIGIIPEGKGGVWLQHRSAPSILHIDPSGNIVKRWEVTYVQAHGFCQDQDGNFWAVDSGPFNTVPTWASRVIKYSSTVPKGSSC
jgi:streptogramin lyase